MAGHASAMRTVRVRRIARPPPLAGNPGRAGRPGNAARGNFGKGKTPGLPGSALRGIPRRIAASGPQKKRACERISSPLPYFLQGRGRLRGPWRRRRQGGRAAAPGAGHKVRPGGPTNWPARRASAAALRGGGAHGQRARPLPLWRERPGYWPRRAVSLSWEADRRRQPGEYAGARGWSL